VPEMLPKSQRLLTRLTSSLKARAERTYAQIPFLMNVTNDIIRNSQPDNLMWRRFWGRVGFVSIDFIIVGLSVEGGPVSKQQLLDVSREIVDLTAFVWLQRDNRLSKHYCDDYTVGRQPPSPVID
jgi:hypothetical protein